MLLGGYGERVDDEVEGRSAVSAFASGAEVLVVVAPPETGAASGDASELLLHGDRGDGAEQ
jgi:hypothetical protein